MSIYYDTNCDNIDIFIQLFLGKLSFFVQRICSVN
jgi:hypothetical protein